MSKQLSVKRLKGQKFCSKSLSNKKRTFYVLLMYDNLSWQLIFTNQKDFEFLSKWMMDIDWKSMDIWFMFKWRFTVRSHNLSPTLTNHPWKGELGWTIVPVGKFRKLAKSSSGPSMATRLERTWIKCPLVFIRCPSSIWKQTQNLSDLWKLIVNWGCHTLIIH